MVMGGSMIMLSIILSQAGLVSKTNGVDDLLVMSERMDLIIVYILTI